VVGEEKVVEVFPWLLYVVEEDKVVEEEFL
jgi:hypothetical protein